MEIEGARDYGLHAKNQKKNKNKNKKIKSSSQESSYTNLKRQSFRKDLKDSSESLGGLNGDRFPCKGGCFVRCVDSNTELKRTLEKTEK